MPNSGLFHYPTLLPDGRIFGQITQKAKQIVLGREILVAGKWSISSKKGQKRGRKIFLRNKITGKITLLCSFF
jgi:hypothetical protein